MRATGTVRAYEKVIAELQAEATDRSGPLSVATRALCWQAAESIEVLCEALDAANAALLPLEPPSSAPSQSSAEKARAMGHRHTYGEGGTCTGLKDGQPGTVCGALSRAAKKAAAAGGGSSS